MADSQWPIAVLKTWSSEMLPPVLSPRLFTQYLSHNREFCHSVVLQVGFLNTALPVVEVKHGEVSYPAQVKWVEHRVMPPGDDMGRNRDRSEVVKDEAGLDAALERALEGTYPLVKALLEQSEAMTTPRKKEAVA